MPPRRKMAMQPLPIAHVVSQCVATVSSDVKPFSKAKREVVGGPAGRTVRIIGKAYDADLVLTILVFYRSSLEQPMGAASAAK